MKTIIYKALILFSAVLVMVGCKSDDMEYHDPKVTPVDNLYAPVDNQDLQLSSQQGASFRFQWSQSHAQDGQLVAYEVVFYKESDKENPVYRISSDNNGKELFANISHIDINKAASAAGVPTGETGVIYWSVVSWRGISSEVCQQKNKLVVTRLEGFEVIPNNVYIVGDATEGGADISNAMVLRKIDDGKFEIYTKLSNQGTYRFVDRLTENPEEYYIDAAGSLADADNNETSSVSEEAVYCISLDFTSKGGKVDKIDKVQFNMCTPKQVIDLPYIGNGVWKGENLKPDFKTNWDDDRYFYFMYINGVKHKAGNKDKDSSAPGSTSGAYFNIGYIGLDSNDWDYCFKFPQSFRNDGTSNPGSVVVDMIFYMNAEKGYTNEIVKKY
ncbi:SusE domain-containing protein [uncultured Dysgonomonas sp.]|uniref:SusE outer membrane protein domain-containing protein n=1 Tax=uncultured Dysgonomonas sp. TaxID=206096 RepID=A0A212JFK6_9BACT|nr:SusE domain-containing protein [uncultured Dysgonomonas sp.]SBV98200.1 conserved exported hypothetical protein [uncultured Dysgonomonas sp.]